MMQTIKGRTPYVPGQIVRVGFFASGQQKTEGLARLNQPLSDRQGSGLQFWSITWLENEEWAFRWIWPADVLPPKVVGNMAGKIADVTEKGRGS